MGMPGQFLTTEAHGIANLIAPAFKLLILASQLAEQDLSGR